MSKAMIPTDSSGHQTLHGLDGSNLLAFLAAVGTLRALSLARPAVGMPHLSWSDDSGIWRPVLTTRRINTTDALLDVLVQSGCCSRVASMKEELEDLRSRIRELRAARSRAKGKENAECRRAGNHELEVLIQTETEKKAELVQLENAQSDPVPPAFTLADDFGVPPEQFANFAERAASSASPDDRTFADFAGSFACECCLTRDGNIDDTAFRAVGGGQTRILKAIRTLVRETAKSHLERSLFHPWAYNDPSPSLRWDAGEFTPYALRATDPAPDQNNKVRGANRLAIEALPLFPAIPSGPRGMHLATTGFQRFGSDLCVSWPIWSGLLDVDCVRSLLAHPLLCQPEPSRQEARALGIQQIFRSRRFTEGQYRNFSPSIALL